MKEHFFIKESLADKITYYHLLAFAITLPFDRLYSELALISLTIHTLIHVKKETLRSIKWPAVLLPCSIYVLTVIGTAYTRFYDEAFFEWERQLAMILFPLIVVCNGFDFRRYRFQVVFALACSCSLTILYLYYTAFGIIDYNHMPATAIFSNAFINHRFSAPIDMHATYFSMYILLGTMSMIYGWIHTTESKYRWLYGLMFLILLAGLIQLSSRAVLIAFAIILFGVLPFAINDRRKRAGFLVLSVLGAVIAFYGITRMDDLKNRMTTGLRDEITESGINENQEEPRIKRWESAWPMIKESPLYGHGSGSEVALLKEIYFKDKLYNSYLHDLNIHNQYLSMLIKTGIPGLLILLYIFFSGIRYAFRKRDLLLTSFMIIICSVSFSENIMDANKGIFYFSFFFALLWLAPQKEKPDLLEDEIVTISA